MQYQVTGWIKARIIILLVLLYMGIGLVVLRVIQLQVIQADQLAQMARNQHRHSIKLPARRGLILDRNHEELAISQDLQSVFAQPGNIEDLEQTSIKLAGILGQKPSEIKAKLDTDKSFVWIRRMLDSSQSEPIRLLKLKGIGLIPESKRFYPGASLAAQVLGFTGIDSQGLEGMEHYYDKTLKGQPRFIAIEKDARGGPILLARSSLGGDALFDVDKATRRDWKGSDLILTLDRSIQYLAEREIKSAVKTSGAKRGGVIVMEPRTGRILAMAVAPGFDPNHFQDFSRQHYRNWLVTDAYEPGSPFKLITISAALEEGLTRPGEVVFCENGSYQIGNKQIHDISRHGALTVEQIIAFSSSIGASKIGQRLGPERMYKHILAYGFGEKTGIDFPGESRGLVRDHKKWSEVAMGTISFGQGVSCTALQMLSAVAAIANDGIQMKPYLVENVIRSDGTEQVLHQPEKERRVISTETAGAMTQMLKYVVSERGTGRRASIEGYQVAGKTGTAQKAMENKRGYAEGKYVCSFVGYVPADDPALVMIVILDEPAGKDPYGGVLAAPVFRKIAKQALIWLSIPAEENAGMAIAKADTDPLAELDPNNYKERLTSEDINLINSKVPGDARMPELKGLTMRQVLRLLDPLELEIHIEGSGVAIEQKPGPLSMLQGISECWIRFSPPR